MTPAIKETLALFDENFDLLKKAQKAALEASQSEEVRENWHNAIEALEEAQKLNNHALTGE